MVYRGTLEYSEEERRIVRELAGKKHTRQIAVIINRSAASVRTWSRKHGVGLSMPRLASADAERARIRSSAASYGLRTSTHNGLFSFWVCVAEDLTATAARAFLSRANRAKRNAAIDRVLDKADIEFDAFNGSSCGAAAFPWAKAMALRDALRPHLLAVLDPPPSFVVTLQ
jgi:hypothetical protein